MWFQWGVGYDFTLYQRDTLCVLIPLPADDGFVLALQPGANARALIFNAIPFMSACSAMECEGAEFRQRYFVSLILY
ncbi:MAG: hypothetical protein EA359_03755 [Balneolaceae bacterium]|nr:MAG: hypothetical protein EA359_03755 [Balneolaceae bacterium]